MVNPKYSRCTAPIRKPKTIQDVTVILLNSQTGYRMRSYGAPALYKIDNKYLIQHQVEIIQKAIPNTDIILVANLDIDKISRRLPKGVRLIETLDLKIVSECDGLRIGLNACITDNIIVINGGLLFNEHALNQIPEGQSGLIIAPDGQISKSEVGITIVDNYPTIFSFNSPTKWAHIGFFANKELKKIRRLCNSRQYSNKFVFELYNEIISSLIILEPTDMTLKLFNSSKEL